MTAVPAFRQSRMRFRSSLGSCGIQNHSGISASLVTTTPGGATRRDTVKSGSRIFSMPASSMTACATSRFFAEAVSIRSRRSLICATRALRPSAMASSASASRSTWPMASWRLVAPSRVSRRVVSSISGSASISRRRSSVNRVNSFSKTLSHSHLSVHSTINSTLCQYNYGEIMLTGAQIRAARGFLGWSSDRNSSEGRHDEADDPPAWKAHDDVPPSRTRSLLELKRVFEEAGIEFIGGPGEGPGVRLWRKS